MIIFSMFIKIRANNIIVRTLANYNLAFMHVLFFVCTVLQAGHAVTPHARLLTSSGDWVWMRAELTRRYKSGTSIPQFWENKITVLRY